jgi:hypothetical protein
LSIHVDSVVTLQRRITVTGFARAFVHKELPIETMLLDLPIKVTSPLARLKYTTRKKKY